MMIPRDQRSHSESSKVYGEGGQLCHSRFGFSSAILAQERDRTPGLEAGECAL
jgi:hypothetical protein